jgi:hypothetical protein
MGGEHGPGPVPRLGADQIEDLEDPGEAAILRPAVREPRVAGEAVVSGHGQNLLPRRAGDQMRTPISRPT